MNANILKNIINYNEDLKINRFYGKILLSLSSFSIIFLNGLKCALFIILTKEEPNVLYRILVSFVLLSSSPNLLMWTFYGVKNKKITNFIEKITKINYFIPNILLKIGSNKIYKNLKNNFLKLNKEEQKEISNFLLKYKISLDNYSFLNLKEDLNKILNNQKINRLISNEVNNKIMLLKLIKKETV